MPRNAAAALLIAILSSGALAQIDYEPPEPPEPSPPAGPGELTPTAVGRPDTGRHGGAMVRDGDILIETVFLKDEARLYLYDRREQPVPVAGAPVAGYLALRTPPGTSTRRVSLQVIPAADAARRAAQQGGVRVDTPVPGPTDPRPLPEPRRPGAGGPPRVPPADLGSPAAPEAMARLERGGQVQGYLLAPVSLDSIETGRTIAHVQLSQIPGALNDTITFAQPVTLTEPPETMLAPEGRRPPDVGGY